MPGIHHQGAEMHFEGRNGLAHAAEVAPVPAKLYAAGPAARCRSGR